MSHAYALSLTLHGNMSAVLLYSSSPRLITEAPSTKPTCIEPVFLSFCTCLTFPLLAWQIATLTEELEMSRGGVRDQLKEKDAKINSLIEELGNSQAMLNDKVAELAEVLSLLI